MKEKQVVQEVFAELAPRYEEVLDDELQSFWGWGYQDYVEFLVNRIKFQDGQTILDIATGTAMIPRRIINNDISGVHVAGLDISESMLQQGKKNILHTNQQNYISLTCGDGMALPYPANSFDIIVTGLASHHMDIPTMLKEIKRTLKENGNLSMIDIGVSPLWHIPIIGIFVRITAFIIFLFRENLTRALAEAAAVTNVFTPDEWHSALIDLGFREITIEEITGKYKWIPNPFIVKASLSNNSEEK